MWEGPFLKEDTQVKTNYNPIEGKGTSEPEAPM